jgi:hypothetical protein
MASQTTSIPGVPKIRVSESFLINCPTEILHKLFPPTPSDTVRNWIPPQHRTQICKIFDTDFSRISRRQFQLSERTKIESSHKLVSSQTRQMCPLGSFVNSNISPCILYSLLKYCYFKSLLQNAVEEDLELGCTIILWFKAFFSFTIS